MVQKPLILLRLEGPQFCGSQRINTPYSGTVLRKNLGLADTTCDIGDMGDMGDMEHLLVTNGAQPGISIQEEQY